MGVFRSLAGSVQLELTSADVSAALGNINDMGITVWAVQMEGDLTARFTVSRSAVPKIKKLAQRKGERLTIIGRNGLFWTIWSLRCRPVLLFGFVLLFLLALYTPTRVLFVRVEGNDIVPSRQILEAAQSAGIGFGASRREVRSEKMKNALLGALPQLQWAGVNTYGCTAVITVRERAQVRAPEEVHTVSSIVASCDGVITSCTVTSGSCLCSVGQAVQKGQVLISGYTDCGQTVTATRAEGEIFAQTQHTLAVMTPAESLAREVIRTQKTYFSLLIGKKRINFVKGSGISDGTCVKMYTEYHLTLPGGYRLPVTLIKETVSECDTQLRERSEAETEQALSGYAKQYLRDHLVALTVMDAKEELTAGDGGYLLRGLYDCTEMIGREQSEQIGDFHGKTD